MRDSIYRISLDIHNEAPQVQIVARKNDSARRIYATMMEHGKPFVYDPRGSRAIMTIKKPDGFVIQADCDIRSDGTIIYDFTESTADQIGMCDCEIALIYEDQVSSGFFAILVDDSAFDGSQRIGPVVKKIVDEYLDERGIDEEQINDGAVTTNKLQDGAVTETKFGQEVKEKLKNQSINQNVITTPLYSGLMSGYADGIAVTDECIYIATNLLNSTNLVVVDKTTNAIINAYPGIDIQSQIPAANDIAIRSGKIYYAMGSHGLQKANLSNPLTTESVNLPIGIGNVVGICLDDDFYYVANDNDPQTVYKINRISNEIIDSTPMFVPFGFEGITLNGGLCLMDDYLVYFTSRPNMLIVCDKNLQFVKYVVTDHSAAEEIEGVDYANNKLYIASKFSATPSQTVNEIRYTSLFDGAFSGNAISYSPIDPDNGSMGALWVNGSTTKALQMGNVFCPFGTIAQAIVAHQKNRGYNIFRIQSNNSIIPMPALHNIGPIFIRSSTKENGDILQPYVLSDNCILSRNSVVTFQSVKIDLTNKPIISGSTVVFYDCTFYGDGANEMLNIRRSNVIFEYCVFENVGSVRATAGSVITGTITGTTISSDNSCVEKIVVYSTEGNQ